MIPYFQFETEKYFFQSQQLLHKAYGNDKEAYELAGELGYNTEGPAQTVDIINQIIEQNIE